MTYEFTLQHQDFLDFQLFSSSKSEIINKKKRNGHIFLTLGSIIPGLYFYFNDNTPMTIYFAVIMIAVALFYPKYFIWRYTKHFSKFITQNYSRRFGETETLEIFDDHIYAKDNISEGRINISEIEEVNETEKHFFIKVITGAYLIIPKGKIENIDSLREELMFENSTYNKEFDWEWK